MTEDANPAHESAQHSDCILVIIVAHTEVKRHLRENFLDLSQ
jgi:hypothetical protein